MVSLLRNVSSKQVPSLRHLSSSSSLSSLLKIGDTLRQTRTFTSEDVTEYGKITFDSNPVHFDPELARNFGFKDSLVHGMLVASMFPRIISSHFPGAIYVSQSLNFKVPVYLGEEIVSEVEAVNFRANKNRYVAKFKTKCYKNGDVIVIDGEAMAILPSLDAKREQH